MLRDNNISMLHLIRTKLFEEKTYKRDIKRFNTDNINIITI